MPQSLAILFFLLAVVGTLGLFFWLAVPPARHELKHARFSGDHRRELRGLVFYELPHLNSAVYHASFHPCTVDNACHGPEPWGVS